MSVRTPLEAPETVLGQLQRGRGAGWRAAAKVSDGLDLLQLCFAFDPRWDAQVEARGQYYASLARHLKLPMEVLAMQDGDGEGALWIKVNVLGTFAEQGNTDALEVLRTMLRPNTLRVMQNATVAEILAASPVGRVGLDNLIVEHFNGQALTRLINWTRDQLPWNDWTARHKKIAKALAKVDPDQSLSTSAKPLDPAEPLRLLKSTYWPVLPNALRHRFVHLATDDELKELREAALGPPGNPRYFALKTLGARRDPIALGLAEAAFTLGIAGVERASLYRYIQELDAEHTLPLARAWLGLSDDRSGVAASLMSQHSEAEDVPFVRTALKRSWQVQDMYALCSLIDALARHPKLGPFDELRTIFTDVTYSYARRRAAAAMAATDPAFAELFAVECLWDCEIETQDIGRLHAKSNDSDVVERLAELERSRLLSK